MSHFVPPYPARPRQPLRPLAMMAAARRNFLAVFDEKCFEYQFFSQRILNRRIEVTAEKPLHVQLDGDPAGMARVLRAVVDPGALVVRT